MIDAVWSAGALLGEGPVWDDRRGLLYFLDIKANRLFEYDPTRDGRRILDLPSQISAITFRERNGMVAAGGHGFAFLDPATGALDPITEVEAALPENRFNDGKCDGRGRFLAGSMDDRERRPSGSVYLLEAGRPARRLFGGFVVCNGPAFSPDGRTLYIADSAGRTILAFDYSPATGDAGDPRPFVRFTDADGYPDGLTVDAKGFLWCAHWDGWKISRFAPTGEHDRSIGLPVPRPTSLTFGGPDLRDLYVTSARIGLSDDQLRAAPLSGSLFRLGTDVAGLPAARFAG